MSGASFARVHHKGRDGALSRVMASLMSKLPNEIDWGLRALTVLAYDGVILAQVPELLDHTLAVVEGFISSAEMDDMLQRASTASPRDKLCTKIIPLYDDSHPTDTSGLLSHLQSQAKLFNPLVMARDVTVVETVGLRIMQVAHILKNLALDNVNHSILAAHAGVVAFIAHAMAADRMQVYPGCPNVVLAAYIHRVALVNAGHEILASLGKFVALERFPDKGRFVAQRLLAGLASDDRAAIINSVTTLSKMPYTPENQGWVRSLDTSVYRRIVDLLLMENIQIVLSSVELLYQASGWPDSAKKIGSIQPAVPALISLMSFHADRWHDRLENTLMQGDRSDHGLEHVDVTDDFLDPEITHKYSFQHNRTTCVEWMKQRFTFTGNHRLAMRRADMYRLYMSDIRKGEAYGPAGIVSREIFGDVVRELFPDTVCVTGASLGRAIYYTGIATQKQSPAKPSLPTTPASALSSKVSGTGTSTPPNAASPGTGSGYTPGAAQPPSSSSSPSASKQPNPASVLAQQMLRQVLQQQWQHQRQQQQSQSQQSQSLAEQQRRALQGTPSSPSAAQGESSADTPAPEASATGASSSLAVSNKMQASHQLSSLADSSSGSPAQTAAPVSKPTATHAQAASDLPAGGQSSPADIAAASPSAQASSMDTTEDAVEPSSKAAPSQAQVKETLDGQPTGPEAGDGSGNPADTSTDSGSDKTSRPVIPQTDGAGGDDDESDDDDATSVAGDSRGGRGTKPGSTAVSSYAGDGDASSQGTRDGSEPPRKRVARDDDSSKGSGLAIPCPNPSCDRHYRSYNQVSYHLFASSGCLEGAVKFSPAQVPTGRSGSDDVFRHHVYMQPEQSGRVYQCMWAKCGRAFSSMIQFMIHYRDCHVVCMEKHRTYFCGVPGCSMAPTKRNNCFLHTFIHMTKPHLVPENHESINRTPAPDEDPVIMAEVKRRESVQAAEQAQRGPASSTPYKASQARATHQKGRRYSTASATSGNAASRTATTNDAAQSAAKARETNQLLRGQWAGKTWCLERAVDGSLAKGVRFTAALTLRNLCEVASIRSRVEMYKDKLLDVAFRDEHLQSILLQTLAELN